jgi:uncharacterized protein YjbI with pentapeptide repeats
VKIRCIRENLWQKKPEGPDKGVDFRGDNFRNLDFSCVDFTDDNIKGVDYRGAIFRNADLNYKVFTNPKLSVLDFNGTILTEPPSGGHDY